jgi:hypothetical protein
MTGLDAMQITLPLLCALSKLRRLQFLSLRMPQHISLSLSRCLTLTTAGTFERHGITRRKQPIDIRPLSRLHTLRLGPLMGSSPNTRSVTTLSCSSARD